jgi:hypothetical protein
MFSVPWTILQTTDILDYFKQNKNTVMIEHCKQAKTYTSTIISVQTDKL